MNQLSPIYLLCFYGIFLILCGVVSVLLIGMKAKTALMSGGMSGALALLIAWLIANHYAGSAWMGIGLNLVLLIVFCWRSAKTLFRVFELIPQQHPDLNGKGIAFLIISLMAVVSIFVLMLQIVLLVPNLM